MKNRLLLFAFTGLLAACRQEIEPESVTLADRLSGTYQTNSFLDVLCIALPPDKMPVADLKVESDSEVTLTVRRFFPVADTQTLRKVKLQPLADHSVRLLYQSEEIGTYQTDRVFTNSGMETQGNVLRISRAAGDPQTSLYFTGYQR
ncbi:hypothetical protein GCM10023189_08240 [Nibrella saemangeumensis]|uniref:Lipocalin-like domain-containing protein n=1 Tax=Nibrella saemangeumensis TaxID=1084526 RepID=A0ABP8MGF9_9BACT